MNERSDRFAKFSILILAYSFFAPGATSAQTEKKEAPRTFPSGYWNRAAIGSVACGRTHQARSVSVGFQDAKSSEQKVRDILSTLKAVDFPSNCGGFGYNTPSDFKPGTQPVNINVWVSDGDLDNLRSRLSGISDSVIWNTGSQMGGISPTVEERWRLLKEELAEKPALLAKTPHVLGLVKAELTRLEPSAKSFLNSKDKTLIQILVYTVK